MHILDEFIKDKFLQDISPLLNRQIFPGLSINDESLNPGIVLFKFLILSDYFSKEIFDIYTEHYKRIIIILEILAAKQGLDIHRQVFSIVRNHINKNNIKLTITDLVTIYLSHRRGKIVVAPEVFRGIRLMNPK